jgi:hypothetical protein
MGERPELWQNRSDPATQSYRDFQTANRQEVSQLPANPQCWRAN